jgi:two-component system response regulator HupR/HoxA
LLATTVADPLAAVREGRLREDLYYALATLTVPLPSLRERSGDIPALTAFFTGLRGGQAAPSLTPPVLAALQAYPWPGNVRELRHVIDYALTLCGGGPVFLSHLPDHVAAAATPDGGPAPGELEVVIGRWLDAALALPESARPDYEKLMDQLESVVLRHLMLRHDQKPTHLANSLRIHRATLRQKLRRAGLQRDEG